jgi:hypothetical protein
VLVVFSSILAAAQEKPLPKKPELLQKTPELLAMIAETRQSLESLPNTQKIPVLFQLLDIELHFTDKQPAQNTIQQVLTLIPSVEKESIQAQIIEAVAFALADIGDYEQCVKTLDLIVKPLVRAEKQLNVAEKIIEDIEDKIKKSNTDKNETVKQFDATDLLRKSLAGAVEAKDAGLESLVSVILGRELAKQGKVDESKILFEKARKKARELEEVEERNLVAVMIRSLIIVDRQPEAWAMIETVTGEENKLFLTGQIAITLAQEGKITDAINLIKIIKRGDEIRNNTIAIIIRSLVKTITVEQIIELAGLSSSDEFQQRLLENTYHELLNNKRYDIIAELAQFWGNVAESNSYHLKLLTDAKKFDEAAKYIETLDAVLKPQASRQLVLAKIEQQGEISEELLNQIFTTYSEEEKKKIELFQQETENVLKIDNPEERLTALLQLSQFQFEIYDLRGVRKTLGLMLETVEKLDVPRISVEYQLLVAELQMNYDKSGAKKTFSQLQKYLDGIKDVRKLKGLFPNESVQPEPTVSETSTSQQSQPIVKLNPSPSADEIEGNNNLFQVYTQIGFLWYSVGENVEAKKFFQKAKEFADSESDVIRKVEKLLTLSLLLAQAQSN